MKFFNVLLLCSLTLVSSQWLLGIAKYNAIPLNYISTKDSEGINFECYIFNQQDCKKFLGRDKILQAGYQPIQINITNNSDKSLIFSLENFSFPCVPYYDVAQMVRFDTAKRVLGWGVPGLFFWPLLIPAIIEAIESPKANERLLDDYFNKALTDQIIEPYTAINGVVFVAVEQLAPTVSCIVIDRSSYEEFKFSAEINPKIVIKGKKFKKQFSRHLSYRA